MKPFNQSNNVFNQSNNVFDKINYKNETFIK